MAHDLAGLGARGAEAHAIHHGVEARLEQLQQQPLAGHALGARRLGVGLAELALEQAVDVAHLLLLAQLLAVVGKPRAALLAVLAGRVGTALDRALVGEALLSLEEELLALPPAVPALVQVSAMQSFLFIPADAWAAGSVVGNGVTSAMLPILNRSRSARARRTRARARGP